MLRFHLDANLPNTLAKGLAQRGIDVTTCPQLGMRDASDEEQLAYCLRENRVIVTHDQDFLVIASQSTEHAGVVYVPMGKRSVGHMVRRLEALAARADLHGEVRYL